MRKLLLIFIVIAFLSGCTQTAETDSEETQTANKTECTVSEKTKTVKTDDMLLFDITAEKAYEIITKCADFITTNFSDCDVDDLAVSTHFPFKTERYTIPFIGEMQNSPTITIYTSNKLNKVCEITIDYDDHAFSPETMKLYSDVSIKLIDYFTPNENNSEELYNKLIINSEENITTTKFLDSKQGELIYSSDGIGFYSYFAYGEYSHICIVPC